MEETIELRELINIVWKGKKTIILSTAVCLLFAGVLSWFVLEEKYESKANIQVVNGTQDMGLISSYIATEFKPDIYAQRIQNEALMQQAFLEADIQSEFSNDNLSVNVEMDTLKSNVELKYTSNNAQSSQQELQILMAKTKTLMSESIHSSLTDLEQLYKIEIDNILPEVEAAVEKYNMLVRTNNLPEILMLQTVINTTGGIMLDAFEQQKTALSNINGDLQNQLLQLQTEIQVKSDEYKKVLANYQSVETSLTSFKADPFIRVITEPTFPKQPSAPSKVLNLALGLIIGVMFGLGLVFVRAFWKNSAPLK